jgi:hypothetical protein
MTAEEVLAFCRGLPPTVTRVEWGGLVVEQAAPPIVRAAPEIGDVEKAQRAKAAERPPSDVESLGHTPPEWKD